MSQTKHPPGSLTMTPEMLLNVAAGKIFNPGLEVTITHLIGFDKGELVVVPKKSCTVGIKICATLTPFQLRNGLTPTHWNSLSNILFQEYKKLTL